MRGVGARERRTPLSPWELAITIHPGEASDNCVGRPERRRSLGSGSAGTSGASTPAKGVLGPAEPLGVALLKSAVTSLPAAAGVAGRIQMSPGRRRWIQDDAPPTPHPQLLPSSSPRGREERVVRGRPWTDTRGNSPGQCLGQFPIGEGVLACWVAPGRAGVCCLAQNWAVLAKAGLGASCQRCCPLPVGLHAVGKEAPPAPTRQGNLLVRSPQLSSRTRTLHTQLPFCSWFIIKQGEPGRASGIMKGVGLLLSIEKGGGGDDGLFLFPRAEAACPCLVRAFPGRTV